jgi:hypothetical protein
MIYILSLNLVTSRQIAQEHSLHRTMWRHLGPENFLFKLLGETEPTVWWTPDYHHGWPEGRVPELLYVLKALEARFEPVDREQGDQGELAIA